MKAYIIAGWTVTITPKSKGFRGTTIFNDPDGREQMGIVGTLGKEACKHIIWAYDRGFQEGGVHRANIIKKDLML